MKNLTKSAIEQAANVVLVHGWILDGAGPARFGYAQQSTCKQVYLGRTLADAAGRLGVSL